MQRNEEKKISEEIIFLSRVWANASLSALNGASRLFLG